MFDNNQRRTLIMLDACENYESCSEAQNNDLVLCTNPNLVPRFLPKNTITRTRSRVVAMLPVASCDRNKEKLYKKLFHYTLMLTSPFHRALFFKEVSLALLFAKMSTRKPWTHTFTRERRGLATVRKWTSWRQQRNGSYWDVIWSTITQLWTNYERNATR